MTWTDERVATLKHLWINGHSASQIALRLHGVSRNAVIGKIFRLGLQRGESRPSKQIVRRPRIKPLPKLTAIRLAPPLPVAPLMIPLADLSDKTCKCGIGDPKEPGFGFCGHDVLEGFPYCPSHCAVIYRPGEKKRVREPRASRPIILREDPVVELAEMLLRAA